MNEMSGNDSKQAVDLILRLEKLVGIERQQDFVDINPGKDEAERMHYNRLMQTDYAEEALNQIKCQLGYLPRREVTMPSEPAIRNLIFEFDAHENIDVLFDSCNLIIDEIYTREMQPHAIEQYPEEVFRLYETELLEYKAAARQRIILLFDYEPKLKNSVYGELIMRCRMAEMGYTVWEGRTEADYEAEAIVWYRENILKTI